MEQLDRESKYLHLPKIIGEEKIKVLHDWITENKDSDNFRWAGHPGTIRRTTRFSESVKYPQISREIKNEIAEKLNIISYKEPDYPDGMVATYGYPNDCCEMHMDPRWYQGHTTFHCIVLLSDINGGNPLIEDQKCEIQRGDGLFYAVSEIMHGSSVLLGKDPRLLWIFGFCIPDEDVKKYINVEQ